MPFKSKAQQRFMFAKHPKIAKRWADEYGVDEDMPEKAGIKEELKRRHARTQRGK